VDAAVIDGESALFQLAIDFDEAFAEADVAPCIILLSRRSQAQYAAEEETWSVSYDPKSVDANGMGGNGKHISVSVEDKTKKAAVVIK